MLTCFGKKYVLSTTNTVYNVTDKTDVPVHRMADGNTFFIARGDENELVKIKLGLMILHGEGKFHLPLSEWEQVKVGFLDDDAENFAADNLYLVYPEEGIPYPELSGYYYIPGFELNAINRDGVVYRTVRKNLYPPYLGGKTVPNSFYPFVRLDVVSGDERKYVHRLLAETFGKPPKGYPKLLVDHNDGNKMNFKLFNLIWVTAKDNSFKAYNNQEARADNNPLEVFDRELGQVFKYVSQNEFARTMEVDSWCIGLVLKRPRSVYKNRYVLRRKGDTRDFQEIWDYKPPVGKKILARNVFTGEITVYNSLAEASRATQVGTTGILTSLSNTNPRSAFKDLQFKRESDETPWPDLNEYELECIRRKMHPATAVYEMFDSVTQETSIVYGVDAVTRITGANPRTVIVCAREGKLLHSRYRFKKLTR